MPDASLFDPEWLGPGDAAARDFDLSAASFERVDSAGHPAFEEAYEILWSEFGLKNELETREVLSRRFQWHPAPGGFALIYEMMVMRIASGIAAIRDHTAIVDCREANCIVHLSHLWVAPSWRRTGVAGWMRAVPIHCARRCLAAAEVSLNAPIDLVGEMEHPHPDQPNRMIRLKAYERAGFLKIDPAAVPYLQPDFRSPAQIDASGAPEPVPMALVLRRVGREGDRHISGRDVRRIVRALYEMYGREFRDQDMLPVERSLEVYPADDARIELFAPTQ